MSDEVKTWLTVTNPPTIPPWGDEIIRFENTGEAFKFAGWDGDKPIWRDVVTGDRVGFIYALGEDAP